MSSPLNSPCTCHSWHILRATLRKCYIQVTGESSVKQVSSTIVVLGAEQFEIMLRVILQHCYLELF